jgi:hypothetical protein
MSQLDDVLGGLLGGIVADRTCGGRASEASDAAAEGIAGLWPRGIDAPHEPALPLL